MASRELTHTWLVPLVLKTAGCPVRLPRYRHRPLPPRHRAAPQDIGQTIPIEGVLFDRIRTEEIEGHRNIANHDAVEFILEDAGVNDITIRNLSLPKNRPLRCGPNFQANDIRFENLVMNSEVITDVSQVTLAGNQPTSGHKIKKTGAARHAKVMTLRRSGFVANQALRKPLNSSTQVHVHERRSGKAPSGFYIPQSVLAGEQRAMSVNGDAGIYGGANVATEVRTFIGALRPRLAVARAGTTLMSGFRAISRFRATPPPAPLRGRLKMHLSTSARRRLTKLSFPRTSSAAFPSCRIN